MNTSIKERLTVCNDDSVSFKVVSHDGKQEKSYYATLKQGRAVFDDIVYAAKLMLLAEYKKRFGVKPTKVIVPWGETDTNTCVLSERNEKQFVRVSW